ncbi:astacin [Cooperia oncophora]
MRLLILALLVAVCVSADLLDLKKTLAVGSLKGLIKEKVTSKIKKTMDRIKEVFNGNMLEFRKKLSGYKDAILKKLTLSPEQRKELVERLKMFKRKTIDQVSPAGDSIEEINLRSQIAGALFQGDMVPFEIGTAAHELGHALGFFHTHSRHDRDRFITVDKENIKIGTAAHELGHALGFFHTHSRHDRDRFITVDKENIKPDWLDQFTLETPATNNNYDLTYDYGSLMHYGATSATRNKLPTMVPKDVQYTQTLGSPFISFYDLLMLNTHYNCTDACKGKYTRCQNHGFAHPRDCSRCICPSGYGGQFCEKKPQDCGRELYATKDWTPLVDDLGNRDSRRFAA